MMSASSSEDDVPLMANNTIDVIIPEQHKTYMQFCCAEGNCFSNFKDLEDRLVDIKPKLLFNYIHRNNDDVIVTSCPMTQKLYEFLFDIWNWKMHLLFEDNYITDLEVNCAGKGKIYAAWRIMDQYCGRFHQKNLTRNIVDIMITIPDHNVVIYEHFCFKYFHCSKGSPYVLIPDKLKTGLAKLYEKYFVDMSMANISERIHFTCISYSHNEDEGPDGKHVKIIPKWYLKELYTSTQRVSRIVYYYVILLHVML